MKPIKIEKHENGNQTRHYRVSTMADAQTLMRRASRYYAHVQMAAHLYSTEEQYKPGYYRACAEMTKAAMTRFIENTMEHCAPHADEYVNVRLYAYTLPGRWNSKTMREGKPRRRVTFYIG